MIYRTALALATFITGCGAGSKSVARAKLPEQEQDTVKEPSLETSDYRTTTQKYIAIALTSLALSTTGCSDNEETVDIKGQVFTAGTIIVDSDINDAEMAPISNDDPSAPQKIPNVATIQGFASATQTSAAATGNSDYENFANSYDQDDFYSVSLQAGQRIVLTVTDYVGNTNGDSFYSGDLDLYLWKPGADEAFAWSEGTTGTEQLTAEEDGEYIVNVYAYSGISKYILQIFPPEEESAAQPTRAAQAATTTATTTAKITHQPFVENEVIVRWKEDTDINQVSAASYGLMNASAGAYRGSTVETGRKGRAEKLLLQPKLTQQTTQSMSPLAKAYPKTAQIKQNLIAMKELRLRDDVEYAVPNYIHTAQLSPDDTLFRLQSHYKDIRLPQAWNLTTGSADVTVAVIDSGVFLDHEDLTDKLVAGYDFISSTSTSRDGDGIDSNPDDPGESSQTGASSWHGTHVTGTIAAATNNNQGTAGVGWNTKVMPLRVLGLNGAGTSYDVMQAVRYAARLSNDSGTLPAKKADIINLSLGSDFFSQAEQDVFDAARNAGVIVVAAAGNASTDRPFYPASYDGVISVSATAPDDSLAYYSNFGSKVDVSAPGGDLRYDLNQDGQADGVLSTSVNDTTGVRVSSYNLQEGTSMATPHVSGVIALMKGVYPDLTPGEFDVLLASGSITIDLGTSGRDNSFGHGRIDALKAILAAADLAGGGDLPAIAVLDSDPTELQFGTGASLDLTLTNANSAAENPAVTYEVSDDWIQVDASQADTNGLGSYSISVNRTGLLDGIYEGNIRFIPDSGYNLDVPVTMQVGDIIANRSLAPVYVLLEDAETGEILDEAIASPLGNFSLKNVPNGTYRLQAGSDIDVDLFICQNGETCGEYPDSLTDEVIEVNGSTVSGISFLVSLISSFDNYSASAGGVKRSATSDSPQSEETTVADKPLRQVSKEN